MTAVRVCARHRTPLRERGDALVCVCGCGEVTRWLVDDGSARPPLKGEREALASSAGPSRHSAATKRHMAASQRKRRARERREASA